MRAVVVEGGRERRLTLGEVSDPQPRPNALSVRVGAISLNRGEVKNALTDAAEGFRPGWDFAGVVEQAPAEGPIRVGERVVGALPFGAWAERVVTSPFAVARLPDDVRLEQAAALPVAGLTALIGLSKRGPLKGLKVLVTAATGGVGLMAVQIAARQEAGVTALIRDGGRAEMLRGLGATSVATSLSEAEAAGPYDIVMEGLGGDTLAAALGMLKSRGIVVLFGVTVGGQVSFDSGRFRHGGAPGQPYGGTQLYGLFLGEEMAHAPPAEPLGRLLDMVDEGQLNPMISVTKPWSEIDQVARDLIDRKYVGKAVLTVD